MKRYFITDGSGLDWRGRCALPGAALSEENENYWFFTYGDPLVALFMNPMTEMVPSPRLWEVEVVGDIRQGVLCWQSSGLRVLRLVEEAYPTQEQHITFGVVCALSLVTADVFTAWGLGWLRGVDRGQEAAAKASLEMYPLMFTDEYVSAAHGVFASVISDTPEYHSACAAWRAFHDSLEYEPLDLAQIARVVATLSAKEIGHMLSGGDDGRTDPGSTEEGTSVCVGDGDRVGRSQGDDGADHDNDGAADVRPGGIQPGDDTEVKRDDDVRGDVGRGSDDE